MHNVLHLAQTGPPAITHAIPAASTCAASQQQCGRAPCHRGGAACCATDVVVAQERLQNFNKLLLLYDCCCGHIALQKRGGNGVQALRGLLLCIRGGTYHGVVPHGALKRRRKALQLLLQPCYCTWQTAFSRGHHEHCATTTQARTGGSQLLLLLLLLRGVVHRCGGRVKEGV